MINKIKWNDRDEWLSIRGKYIGGSDAGAIVGMNPYKGAYAVWMEKTGRSKPFDGNIATETGTILEPYVAELFERETGKKVRRDNHTLVNDLYPWACANVDRRVIGEDALLECKTTSSLPNIRKFAAGEYPEQWYCQMTHYLAVTGAQRIYLAVLIGNREFKVFPPLERDDEEIEALMRAEREFWTHVENDTEPNAGAMDGDAVADAYPGENETDTVVDLTAEADLLREYEIALANKKQAEERADEIKNRLCVALGENTTGVYKDYTVKWKSTGTNSFDIKAFKEAFPNIDYAPYYKVKVTRRFTFGKGKK